MPRDDRPSKALAVTGSRAATVFISIRLQNTSITSSSFLPCPRPSVRPYAVTATRTTKRIENGYEEIGRQDQFVRGRIADGSRSVDEQNAGVSRSENFERVRTSRPSSLSSSFGRNLRIRVNSSRKNYSNTAVIVRINGPPYF